MNDDIDIDIIALKFTSTLGQKVTYINHIQIASSVCFKTRLSAKTVK